MTAETGEHEPFDCTVCGSVGLCVPPDNLKRLKSGHQIWYTWWSSGTLDSKGQGYTTRKYPDLRQTHFMDIH